VKDKDTKILEEAYNTTRTRSSYDADFAPGREDELMGKECNEITITVSQPIEVKALAAALQAGIDSHRDDEEYAELVTAMHSILEKLDKAEGKEPLAIWPPVPAKKESRKYIYKVDGSIMPKMDALKYVQDQGPGVETVEHEIRNLKKKLINPGMTRVLQYGDRKSGIADVTIKRIK